ncbi:hypothetical protein [Lunatimonas salinarum]|uniref:hypothetical protein n=1 Tax=Lunatimonas salinarum TaxID=1774590 RepID=UPI001ADF64FF|nr:hypothetical protein [Lunatimonas salinarum]
MHVRLIGCKLFLVLFLILSFFRCADPANTLSVVGGADSDMIRWLEGEGFETRFFDDALSAAKAAKERSVILVLASGYPERRTAVSTAFYETIKQKGQKVYVEFPDFVPGIKLDAENLQTRLERGVVASSYFGSSLDSLQILGINDCHLISSDAANPLMVLAKVAGLDRAEYGLTGVPNYPLLVKGDFGFVSFSKFSDFGKARYGPEDHWKAVLSTIIADLTGKDDFTFDTWPRYLSPTLLANEAVSEEAKRESVQRGVDWFAKGKFFIHSDWKDRWLHYQSDGLNPVGPPVPQDEPVGDGTLGLLEGHSSNIYHDGSQQYRYWIRADVQGEGAYALAAASRLSESDEYRQPAINLIDFIFKENLRTGPRSHPDSAAYGLIGWSHTHPHVYYGDDNARAILGILGASAHLELSDWDREMVEAILANFRTTGKSGFRMNRLENKDLHRNGWKYYWDRDVVNPAPHFESWMWALYLWLYDKTGHEPLLEKAKSAIRITMEGYPDEWLWTNGIQQERARMILPLAWLVRVEDTPEHRGWLDRIVSKLLENQVPSGAIREELGGEGKGRYGKTKSNEEYGLHEAPLIFANGDPIADMLYTSNFAFFSLNEAAHATGNSAYFEALKKLSDFLTRIQVKSERFPDLDGAWFRAFDYERWEFWASNADVGWGAWGTLTGWTQSWIVATQVLVLQKQSYWELTSDSQVNQSFPAVHERMFQDR